MSTLRAVSTRAYAASILSCVALLSACSESPAGVDNAAVNDGVALENAANAVTPVANETGSNEAAPTNEAPAETAAETTSAAEPASTPAPAALAAPAAVVAATTAAAPAGDAANGAKLFVQCRVCHAVEPGKNGLGPSLHGVVGRKAGTLAGFNFSPAMQNSGTTWTAKALSDYLRAPMKALPGTKMAFAGIPDEARRADVIAYLETLK